MFISLSLTIKLFIILWRDKVFSNIGKVEGGVLETHM